MILRIEDTDVERSEARFESQLLDDLKWLGIDWDEGPDVGGAFAPYRQSDRTGIYQEHGERLLSEGKAYLCFCTAEELEAERQKAIAEHRPQIYSGKCRKLDPAESLKRRAGGEQRSEEHTSELQSPCNIVCRLLLGKKKKSPTARCSLSGEPTCSYIRRPAHTMCLQRPRCCLLLVPSFAVAPHCSCHVLLPIPLMSD